MSGMLKGVVYSPDEAEMGAIANAVHYLFGQKWPLTRVIVNTDSMNAIHVLTGDRKNIKKYNLIDKKYDLIRSSIAKNTGLGFKIEYRHVKAHQGTGTKRQYCNEWCDQEAKKQLSKYHEADKRANP